MDHLRHSPGVSSAKVELTQISQILDSRGLISMFTKMLNHGLNITRDLARFRSNMAAPNKQFCLLGHKQIKLRDYTSYACIMGQVQQGHYWSTFLELARSENSNYRPPLGPS